jgi:hypothetical protein
LLELSFDLFSDEGFSTFALDLRQPRLQRSQLCDTTVGSVRHLSAPALIFQRHRLLLREPCDV